jgi:hypothetical protein
MVLADSLRDMGGYRLMVAKFAIILVDGNLSNMNEKRTK